MIACRMGASSKIGRRGEVLAPSFFNRPTLQVARELLGKALVRRYRGRETRVLLVEVEAYDGPADAASHAHRGLTPRTRVMFGRPGVFYVYFTYGMHWMLNVVTGPAGFPAAVLIRAGAVIDAGGAPVMVRGPARLTRFVHIGRQLNGRSASKRSGLWFEDLRVKVPPNKIIAGKRVGVEYAGEWKEKPYNLKIDAATLLGQ